MAKQTKKRTTQTSKARRAEEAIKQAPALSDMYLPVATPELTEKQRNILKVHLLPHFRHATQAQKAEWAGVTTRYYRDAVRGEAFRRYEVAVSRAILKQSIVQVALAYVEAGFEGGPLGRPIPEVMERILEQEHVLEPKTNRTEHSLGSVTDDDLIERAGRILGTVGATVAVKKS